MSTRLRAGVVGLGWAGQQHLNGYQQLTDVDIVGLAGPETDKLASLGAEYGVEGTYPDLTTMLAEANLDVVSLGTPTALHAPMAIEALEAGVHVLSEKPMAETAERSRAMVDAALANDRVLEVTFNKRQGAEIRTLKEIVDRGTLGDIYYAKAGWVRRHGIPGLGSWFTQKAWAGGGPMMDIGIHALDLALDLMGEPQAETVSGSTYAMFGPRGRGGSGSGSNKWRDANSVETGFEVEDLGTAFVRMDNGATLLLEASWSQFVPADRLYLEIYGTEGGARFQFEGGVGSLDVNVDIDGVRAELLPRLHPAGAHPACVADFVAVVASGQWEGRHGEIGHKRTEIIDACYASAAQRAEVSLR